MGTNEADATEFKELRAKIESSKAFKINAQDQQLQVSIHIFSTNYGELEDAINLLDSPDFSLKLWEVKNREELKAYHIDVIRLFHNTLAGAKSLVEHTRIIVREMYREADFWNEYDAKVRAIFGQSGLSHFVQDLRNYILHKGLPATKARLHWSQGEDFVSTILLDIDEVKKWDKFSKEAVAYISTLPKEIELRTVMREYRDLVQGFYQWFGTRQQEMHARDFAELQGLQDRFRAVLRRAGLPVPGEDEV